MEEDTIYVSCKIDSFVNIVQLYILNMSSSKLFYYTDEVEFKNKELLNQCFVNFIIRYVTNNFLLHELSTNQYIYSNRKINYFRHN